MSERARGICAIGLLAVCASCSLPPLSLTTPQPIKVDLAMKLDVYQHSPPGAEKKPAASTGLSTPEEIQNRRRLRLGELQPLKNSRLVGESHLGLLEVRNAPPGEYGGYVRDLVAAENKDRTALIALLASTQKISPAEVQKEQAETAAHSAFNGEWIETQRPDGSWVWTQKGAE